MLEIYNIHHLPSARKNVILGISDDPVDAALVTPFRKQTDVLTQLVSNVLGRQGASAAVYTSSMRRQKQTSELLFGHTDLPIIIDERLRQIDNGPQYTGMDSRQAKQDYAAYIDSPFPGGESFNDFATRVRAFLEDTWRKHETHTVITVGWRLSPAIFAHICRGVGLEEAIVRVKDIRGPFIYSGGATGLAADENRGSRP